MTSQGLVCSRLMAKPAQIAKYYKPATVQKFNFPGLKIASVVDGTLSTGATLFYFTHGGLTVYDARGGSVAASETTLLDSGSYSAMTDGIVFAGGSTMGLAASSGARDFRFRQNLAKGVAGDFDFIPSFPSAIVYDYGGRIAPFNEVGVYPNEDMGRKLMENLSDREAFVGRAGAGITTTVNKVGVERWGGQGIVQINTPVGKVLVAVVLNALGDVVNGDVSLTEKYTPAGTVRQGVKPGRNTTLSLIVTSAKLNRNQLQRLVTMVHTSMGASIAPFHSSEDGDIQFAVSTGHQDEDEELSDADMSALIAPAAAEAMKQAIRLSLDASNDLQ